MSVGRALVECAVLAVQDASLFYPRCEGCFSRLEVRGQDSARCRCPRCGHSCLREQVEYRYRLSLKVARDRCIFGVTVFGTCLNPFFGIHASGLQRLVENADGPVGASTRATLLIKAVRDCFVGRHFVFGIKVTGTESGLWFGGPVANGSGSRETVQFVASQMILPTAAGLRGCTVVSYYRVLLQRATEQELGLTDPSKSSRPPSLLLLLPHQSPESSFNNATPPASGLLSPSPQRSQHQDSTLTPTPWEQSLGLVTSSAEQEEGCSIQNSGDGNNRRTNNKTQHHVQRDPQEKGTERPLLSEEHSSYSSPSFTKQHRSLIRNAVENSPFVNPWFSPSQREHKRVSPLSCQAKEFSASQLPKASLSGSLAWEDLPFSESLSEFLCEEDKDFDNVGETESHLNVRNQNKTVKNNLQISAQDKNLSVESTSVCESNPQTRENDSQLLLDITNTPALANEGERLGLSEKINQSQTTSACSHRHHQEDEEASSLSFENKEEGDAYDCSADLFSSSLMTDANTKTLNTHRETVRMIPDLSPTPSSLEKQQPRDGNIPYSTPNKQKRKTDKSTNRDSLIPPGTQALDFIPPAQSTPIVKVAAVSESPASPHWSSTLGCELNSPVSQSFWALSSDLPEFDGKKPTEITTSLCKRSAVGVKQPEFFNTRGNPVWSTTSSRHHHKFTPKKWFSKPNEHQNQPPHQKRLKRRVLNPGSTVKVDRKRDSSLCDATACDYDESEVIVPPTPPKTRRRQIEDSSRDLDPAGKAPQRHGVSCKTDALDHHPASPPSSQRTRVQTGSCDSETVDERSGEEDENLTCDCSRDLFSSSI